MDVPSAKISWQASAFSNQRRRKHPRREPHCPVTFDLFLYHKHQMNMHHTPVTPFVEGPGFSVERLVVVDIVRAHRRIAVL